MNNKGLDLFDKYGEEICEMCELYILGCPSNTYHFQCEGSRCEQAHEMFEESDEYLELLIERREEIINKILQND
jgi:hypothetical protein